MGTRRVALVVALATASVLALAGCVQSGSTTAAKPSQSASSAPKALATPKPTPTFIPKGTAAQNFRYFALVGHSLLDHDEGAQGRKIIDYFVAHGFNKADMELTPDKTSIGLEAWNIEFSVKMNGGCIIGQAGNVHFHAFVTTVLASGKCLIGQTRKINW